MVHLPVFEDLAADILEDVAADVITVVAPGWLQARADDRHEQVNLRGTKLFSFFNQRVIFNLQITNVNTLSS